MFTSSRRGRGGGVRWVEPGRRRRRRLPLLPLVILLLLRLDHASTIPVSAILSPVWLFDVAVFVIAWVTYMQDNDMDLLKVFSVMIAPTIVFEILLSMYMDGDAFDGMAYVYVFIPLLAWLGLMSVCGCGIARDMYLSNNPMQRGDGGY